MRNPMFLPVKNMVMPASGYFATNMMDPLSNNTHLFA